MTAPVATLGVHWAVDVDMSSFASPSNTSNMSFASTSTLQYVNSQLVAHGFSSSPGLCLDGLSNRDMEVVVKCVLGMLSQRVQDMARTEDLTAKFRTLSYDYDRLTSMHRSATEKAESAEKEMTLHKSRLAASARELQTTNTSLRNTTLDLQRTRMSLQALRQAHTSELKRRAKETERMVEKWTRLAEVQSKLNAAPSGLVTTCANAAAVEGATGMEGYLDIALKEAENTRRGLAEENTHLRELVLRAVNDLQATVSMVKSMASPSSPLSTGQEYTQTTLFPLGPPDFPHALDTIASLVSSLRESIEILSRRSFGPTTSATSADSNQDTAETKLEVTRLQETVDTLRAELEQAQEANARETQALFDRFITEQERLRETAGDADLSLNIMIRPEKDAERDLVDALRKQLDAERERFTQAALKLGEDKAKLEAEKLEFLDEKRQWQVEMMLADLPPTPAPASSPHRPKASKAKPASPRRSPNSPLKKSVGRKARAPRRSSIGYLTSPSKHMVAPSYETEVIPPAPTAGGSSPFGGLLSTAFVLPPPSPFSSLPTQPVVVSLSANVEPAIPEERSPTPASPQPSTTTPPSQTPRRPFPVAKPHVQHMVHAYSPAKPSPLSRILKLAESPTGASSSSSSSSGELGAIDEPAEDEAAREEMFPAIVEPVAPSLAAELGLLDAETPPWAGPGAAGDIAKADRHGVPRPNGKTHPRPQAHDPLAKGKGKPVFQLGALARPSVRGGVPLEKENDAKRTSGSRVPSGSAARSTARAMGSARASGAKSKVLPTSVRGGPARRVPIDGSAGGRRA